jgi:hypothetical protein
MDAGNCFAYNTANNAKVQTWHLPFWECEDSNQDCRLLVIVQTLDWGLTTVND